MNEIMRNETELIVSQLYVLRAGLSTISQEKDKAQKVIDSASKRRDKNLNIAQQKKDKVTKDLKCAKDALDKAIEIKSKNEIVANSVNESSIRQKEFALNMSRIGLLITCVLELVFLALLIWSILFLAVYFDAFGAKGSWIQKEWLKTLFGWAFGENGGESTLSAVLFWFAPLLSLGFTILGGFLIKKAYGCLSINKYRVESEISNNKKKHKQKDKAISNLDIYEQEVTYAKEAVQEKQQQYDIACNDYPKECNEIENTFEDDKQKALKHIVAGMEMWSALTDTFSKKLDVRDWNNIDLIIYYLETQRADTIKEALQLADREKQTERIEVAMSKATEEITRQIEAGVNYLENYMGKCTSLLSDHIANCSSAIIKQVSSLESEMINHNSKIDSISTYLTKLSSQVNMNNALRKKANVCSAQLVEDVHQLRMLADANKI